MTRPVLLRYGQLHLALISENDEALLACTWGLRPLKVSIARSSTPDPLPQWLLDIADKPKNSVSSVLGQLICMSTPSNEEVLYAEAGSSLLRAVLSQVDFQCGFMCTTGHHFKPLIEEPGSANLHAKKNHRLMLGWALLKKHLEVNKK